LANKELIDGLNHALASEFQAVIQYLHYASMVKGLDRLTLAKFFEEEIADELKHARFLSDKIVALGGKPTVQPLPVESTADPRRMLELVLQAEEQAVKQYTGLAQLAEKAGMKGLQVALEDMVADETRHAEETRLLLS